LTLSIDHRAVDGALDLFLAQLKDMLEQLLRIVAWRSVVVMS
jgi:pyruvate/2-oxoglutarate dehydrogenase complex dihydrolipoamide acyltransferase (E2) component